MSTLNVISSPQIDGPDLFSREKFNQNFVRTVRLLYLAAILVFVLFLQNNQSTFINAGILLPLYFLLSISFLFNSVYLLAYEKIGENDNINSLFFALDALIITGFNYFSQGNYAIFLVLYLLNIVLCGVKYKTEGAVLLAMWTSALFSLLLVFGPEVTGQKLYISLVLNNFAFFTIAFLSGSLSQQFIALNLEVERKRKDLKSLQKLNEMIISNIANGLVAVDKNWRVTQFNSAAESILNCSLESKTLKEVFFRKFDEIQASSQAISTEGVKRIEFDFEIKAGEISTLEIIISPLIGEKGEHQGFIFLMQDLTNIKKLEQELRQQEKLAAVGQLAAGIAHEIRNPLASISGSIQLLSAGGETSAADAKKLMGITIKEIDRLNGLISEFLEYVKPEQMGSDYIDLNEVLKEVLSMTNLNDRLNSSVEQIAQFNGKQIIVGNPSKIKQAFLNIIINAYQAMDNVDSGKLKVVTYDEKDRFNVSITDTGKGISEQDLPRIFEPFHTTKPSGTGLGLAISHKILQGHGALVNVVSQEGEGTTFEISFPVGSNPIGNEMKLKKEA